MLRLFVPMFLLLVLTSLPAGARAATIYFDPDVVSYGPGDTFVAVVRLDNEEECINAGEITISYPKNVLRAVDVSRGDSIFTLWVEEPHIDYNEGFIRFSGGVPGGYCGRIQGDPALSNVLAKVVFTILSAEDKTAAIEFSPDTAIYLNDGLGTRAELETRGVRVTLLKEAKGASNPWLEEVNNDSTPPDPFAIEMHTTEGVFGGRRYVIFTTVDKQSGIDHYEIFERGAWKPVTSPYPLRYELFPDAVQVRAVDKAGNTRLADFGDEATANPSTNLPWYAWVLIWVGIGGILLLLGGVLMWRVKQRERLHTV